MKDQTAREQIANIKDDIRDIMNELKRRVEAEVKYCPKCKHCTPQEEHYQYNSYNRSIGDYCVEREPNPYDYLCLVCGSKLKTQTTCEIIKEDK